MAGNRNQQDIDPGGGGGSEVTNAGTFAVQEDGDLLTAVQSIVAVEDAAQPGGQAGVVAMTKRQDTPTEDTSATEDNQPLKTDEDGYLHTRDGYKIGGEDVTNDVMGVQIKPLAVNTYVWSLDQSAALEASSVSKASAGLFRSVQGRIDSTAPTATYYYQLLNAASLPADGAVTLLRTPLKIQHITGYDSLFTIDIDNGIYASTGIVQCLSSTEFTKTISSAYLSTNLFYK